MIAKAENPSPIASASPADNANSSENASPSTQRMNQNVPIQ